MTPSDRTKVWAIAHPDKTKALVIRNEQRRKERQQEALRGLDNSKYKTPIAAIMAFCRKCQIGRSHGGGVFPRAHVYCKQTDCPLHAFRNTNPNAVRVGMRHNNIIKHRKQSV